MERTFANGEFYHIYNRGVDKRAIFNNENDVSRFLQSMEEFNSVSPIGSLYEISFERRLGHHKDANRLNKLAEFVCYCLNPNHYHFILEQVADGGISELMRRLGGGYTWHFNNRYDRSGSLFQGKFKVIHINSNEYLLHLSAYVNLNDRVHQLGGKTAKLVRSSWKEYLHANRKGSNISFCKKDIILEQFRDGTDYKKFALDSLRDIKERRREEMEYLLLE